MTVGGKDLQACIGQALSVERRVGRPGASSAALAALLYGEAAAGIALPAIGCVAGVPATVLHPAGAVHDLWCVDGPVQHGQTGRIRWAKAGPWLYGALECPAWDDAAPGVHDLAHAAESVYRELMAFLQASNTPHLLRLWNYLPHINREDDGLERYRHFNIGRQRALLGARAAAFEGSPAACALGTYRGPLCLRFLAGATPATAIENPRQVSAYRYPAEYGPASPSFSRAALLDAGGGQLALLISGTASIVGHATAHAGDWRAQLDETVRNLQAVITAARARCSADFRLADGHCVVYVREPALAGAVQTAFEQIVGPHSTAAQSLLVLHADVCRSDLLLEIEAHAWAPGTLAQTP